MLATQDSDKPIDIERLNTDVERVTAGLLPFVKRELSKMPPHQIRTVCDFIIAMEIELNPSADHRRNYIVHSYMLSRFHGHQKAFREMTRDDLLAWLLSCKKPEDQDRKHKWIGTYNKRVDFLKKFYRWLYYPDDDRETRIRDRPLPPQLVNIRKLKRKEKSIYSGSDMWLPPDDEIFLKYCPSKMIKCWHMMDDDMSCRPKELTKLTVGDVRRALKEVDGRLIGEITVTGKTGQRPLPLYRSIPYILEWLNEHPLKDNDDAPFFIDRDTMAPLTPPKLNGYYHRYKKGYTHKGKRYSGHFQRLLKDPKVPFEDKVRIEALLKKPWNPYVLRHSALTEKRKKLPGPLFNQHSGHAPGSKIPDTVYVHLLDGESSKTLLEIEGVIKKDRTVEDILKPQICTRCKTPNSVNADFCSNKTCQHPLSEKAVAMLKEQQEQTFANIARRIYEERELAKYGCRRENSEATC